MRAVVIDAEAISRAVASFLLHEAGYDEIMQATGIADSLDALTMSDGDLVLLRPTLRDGDGVALCASLRAHRYRGPIIMLGAKEDLSLTLRALAAGADAYLVEPITPQEFVARVRAIARRYEAPVPHMQRDVLTVGDVQLVLADHTVCMPGKKPVRLTPTEFRLFEYLLRNSEIALGRQALVERVWGPGIVANPSRLDVHIRRLRRKIEPDPSSPVYLQTVRGVGFIFRPLARTSAQEGDARGGPTPESAAGG